MMPSFMSVNFRHHIRPYAIIDRGLKNIHTQYDPECRRGNSDILICTTELVPVIFEYVHRKATLKLAIVLQNERMGP
ncbi:Hypothetical predicted protein [Octopus vulgaris]|uniref:Uncharacterized protein n=1 Tax=Octopus vulgaris TaxID=6645 RepID=A0AA36BLL6_OCTVU|nr:Hypothetical predicted protein [Octopus vulgaris]